MFFVFSSLLLEIDISYVLQVTLGWDWIQSTPDRNTGLWDIVTLKLVDGPLKLHDPTVRIKNITTALDQPPTVAAAASSRLSAASSSTSSSFSPAEKI